MHQGRWKRRWQTLPCGLHKDEMQIYSGSKDKDIFLDEIALTLTFWKQNSNIAKTISWYPVTTKQAMKGVKRTWQNLNQ